MMASLTRIAPLLLLVLVAGCGGDIDDPEQQVRAWVDAMQEAAEEKARGDIVENISSAYVDSHGYDRDDIAAGHGTASFNATPRPPRRTPIALECHRQANHTPPGRRSKCPDHRNRSDLAAINAKGQAVKSP